MDLMDLFIKIGVDTKELDDGIDKADKKIASFQNAIKGIGVAIGAVAGTVAVVKGVSDTVTKGTRELAEYGDNIDKMSQKLGISAEAYQEWDAVMKHSGTSIDSMKASMKTLSAAAEKGSEAFDKLGISQEQVAQMSQEELFSTTITALQNVEDETERARLATKLLGRGARELGALLNTTAEETQEMKDRVHELGGVLSDEAVKAAAKFQDNLQDMTTAFDGVKRGIFQNFLPGLNALMEGFTALMLGEEEAENKLSEGFDKLADGFKNAVDRLKPIAQELIPRIVSFITNSLPELVSIGSDIIDTLATALMQNLDSISKSAIQIVLSLAKGLSERLPDIIPAAVDMIFQISETIVENLDKIIAAAAKIIRALIDGLVGTDALTKIISGTVKLIGMIAGELVSAIKKSNEELGKDGESILTSVIKGLIDAIKNVNWKEITDDIADEWLKNGGIDTDTDHLGLIDVGKMIITQVAKGIRDYTIIGQALHAAVEGGKNMYYQRHGIHPTLEEGGGGHGGKRGDTTTTVDIDGQGHGGKRPEQIVDEYTEQISEYGASLQRQAESWKKDGLDTVKALEDAMADIDHEYATHQIDEETYLKKKLNKIKLYHDEESEEWWKYYDDTIARIDKIEEDKRKEQEQQDQKTKQAQQQREQELRKTIKRQFEAFEKQMIKEGKDDKWLVGMERAYIEKLDHASDIYWEYDLQISRQEKKINDSMQAEREKNLDDQKNAFESKINDMIKSAKTKIGEYQKALESIKEKMRSFGESLTKAYTDAFSFGKDEKTGKVTAKKTKNFITDATKQLEEYYKNIQKLRDKHISDAMLNQLQSMNVEEGNALAEYWLSLTDEQLKNQSANWARYEKAGQDVAGALYSDEVQKAEQELDQTRNTLLGEIKAAIDEGTGGMASILSTTFDAIGNMGIVINVAGENVITSTINKYLKNTKNTGAVLDV